MTTLLGILQTCTGLLAAGCALLLGGYGLVGVYGGMTMDRSAGFIGGNMYYGAVLFITACSFLLCAACALASYGLIRRGLVNLGVRSKG